MTCYKNMIKVIGHSKVKYDKSHSHILKMDKWHSLYLNATKDIET